MIKKALGIFLLTVCSAAAAVVVWQPSVLQKRIVDRLLLKVSQQSRYRVRVDSVSGNFFTHLSLNGIHVNARNEEAEVLRAEAVHVGIKWEPLFHHRLEISRLIWIAPVVRLTIGPDGKWVLPEPKKSGATPLPFSFYMDHVEITRGTLIVVNQSLYPESSLKVAPIELKASVSPERVEISALSLGLGQGSMTIQGRLELEHPIHTALTIETRDFPIQQLLRVAVVVPEPLRLIHSGHWKVTGDGAQWMVRTSGLLDQSEFGATLEAQKGGHVAAHILLAKLPLRNAWRDPHAGRMGALSAALELSGPQWKSKAVNVSGSLHIVQPSSGPFQAPTAEAQIHLAQGRGPVQVIFNAEGLQAAATAQIDMVTSHIQGLFQLNLQNFKGLSEWIPALQEAQGSVVSEGALQGPFDHLAVDAKSDARHLRFQKTTVDEIHVNVQSGSVSARTLILEGSAKNIVLHDPDETPWDISAADFHAEGKNAQWQTNATLKFRNKLVFHYAGLIQKQMNAWRLDWDTLDLSPKKGASLHSTQAGEAILDRDGAVVVQGLDLSTGKGNLSLPRGTYRRGFADVALVLKEVDVASLTSLVLPDKKYTGVINGEIRAHGSLRAPDGIFDLRISTGSIDGWEYKELDAKVRIAPPWIFVDQFAIVTPHAENNIRGAGRLPLHMLNADQPDQAVDFHLEAPHLDPAMLAAAVPGLTLESGGNASLALDVKGRYANPDVEGQLIAHFPRIVMDKAGLDVRDFSADIRSHGKMLTIHELQGKTKKGEFHGGGQSELPHLDFTLKGKDLQLHIPKQLDARFDMDLALKGDLEGPDLSGDIALEEATYTMAPAKKKENENADQDEKTPVLGDAVTLNIHAAWPRNVWYRDGLSKIETSGDIKLQKDNGSAPYMTGRISVIRGSYDVYGRDFTLNSGDLVFTGPPDINPALDLEATYTGGGTIVYLDIKGTAKNPQPSLRSDPPLPENDIISVLIFGHPLNQINAGATAEQSQSQQAQAMAGSVLGGYLTKSLRESGMNLGLDVVRVDPSNTGGNRLTVGRYIGQKLFVSYGQPLQNNAVRVFDANYYLSHYWSVVGETGASTDSFLDLLFRYPLNQPANSHSAGFSSNTPYLPGPVQALPFPQPNPTPSR